MRLPNLDCALRTRRDAHPLVRFLERPVARTGRAHDVADAPAGAASHKMRREGHGGSVAIFPKRRAGAAVYAGSTQKGAAMLEPRHSSFIHALHAGGPAPDRADKLGL